METYSVILGQTEVAGHKQLVDVLKTHFKLINYEAELAVRRSWGFLAEKVSKPEADNVRKQCLDRSITAFVIADSSIAVLPVSKQCVSIDCAPGILNYTLDNKESGSVAWDDIFIAASASIPEQKINVIKEKAAPSTLDQVAKAATLSTIGIPVSFGRKKEVTRTVRENIQTIYLELFFGNMPSRIQINGNYFNYAYLGKRKEYSTITNFYTMLGDIGSLAKKARTNSGFIKMSRKEQLSQLGYDSHADFEKELKWLLTLQALKL